MPRKKSDSSQSEATTAINFRCNTELKRNLEVLRFATQEESISVLIIGLCEKAVEANLDLINTIKEAAKSKPVQLPIFTASEPTPPTKKNATKKNTRKKVVEAPDSAQAVNSAGDNNENN